MKALVKEIYLTAVPEGETIETIYLGGGTPSLLTAEELQNIFAALKQKFTIASGAEITIEANPDDITVDMLNEWKLAGINRLSLGLQSFNEAELKWMNRAHNAQQSRQSIDEIINAGFSNFSVDLIYGSPLLSDEQLVENAMIVIDKKIPHISCYALTVEPRTSLDKMIVNKKSQPVDPAKQSAQFLLLMKLMKQHGYEHYEISNFALPGMRSRHNSSYWQGSKYYGFGPSAHSFDGQNKRRWNIANNSIYMRSLENEIVPFEEEILTDTEQLNEYIMISLRTKEGLIAQTLAKRFGDDELSRIERSAKKYIETGKLVYNDGALVLTDTGKLYADGIAADLFATSK